MEAPTSAADRAMHFCRTHLQLVTIVPILLSLVLYFGISAAAGAVNLHFNDNCRTDWFWTPDACVFGNVFGWLSGGVWYAQILSQIIKDGFFTNCKGLSVVWAWMNFTSATLNGFAVFYWKLPLFSRVMSVYMPVLEAIILCQLFWFRRFDRKPAGTHLTEHQRWLSTHGDVRFPLCAWLSAVLLYAGLLVVGILASYNVVPPSVILEAYSWAAIGMWSVESFIQIFLNWRVDTCEGQSYWGLGLTLFGKASDFLVQWILVMPGRYLFLSYFSSAAGMMNVAQAVWMINRKRLRGTALWAAAWALLAVIAAWVYGFMTYVFIFSPFPGPYDTYTESWLHTTSIRWYLSWAPPLVTGAAVVGLLWSRWHGTIPLVFPDPAAPGAEGDSTAPSASLASADLKHKFVDLEALKGYADPQPEPLAA